VNRGQSVSLSASLIPFLVWSCLVVSTAASPVLAEEEEQSDQRNVVSLVLGGSSNKDENAFAVGLDFEHRVHPLLGVGAVVEYAAGDIDAVSLLGVVDLHLWKGLAIQTGPGVEFVREEEEVGEGTTSVNRTEFLYRVGLVYEFEIGRLLVIPQVHYDYSSGKDSVVYATALGFKF